MIVDKILLKRLVAYIILLPFLPLWWLQIFIKRNSKIWIYGSWHAESYSDNSRALFEYANKRHNNIVHVWLTRNNKVYNHLTKLGYNCYKTNSFIGIFFSLKAKKIIISCAKSDVNRFFINGAKIFHLWHGAPMKKIGQDENIKSKIRKQYNRELDNNFFWRFLPKYIFTFFDEYNVDYLVSTSKQFSSHLQSAFDLSPDRILLTGYPRNDKYFTNGNVGNNHILVNNEITIYYLPTFRSEKGLESLFYDYGFSFDRMEQLLKKINGKLFFKGHFGSKIDLEINNTRIIHIKNDPILDTNYLLKKADILITDYSGCYFDFLLLDRPIIFTPFDYDDYTKNDRELYFDYYENIAGFRASNWNDVENEILNIYNGNDNYKVIRSKMKNRFNTFKDSKSSNRLFDIIHNI